MQHDQHSQRRGELAEQRDQEREAALELSRLIDELAPTLAPGELRDIIEITRLIVTDYAQTRFGVNWDELPDSHLLSSEGTPLCLEIGIRGEPNTMYEPHPLSRLCCGCITVMLLEVAFDLPDSFRNGE